MIVPPDDLAERGQLVRGIGRPAGVARRVDQHPLGPRPDRRLQVFRRNPEAQLLLAVHEHRGAARQQRHVRVGHPVGRRDDDFVALVQRGDEGVVKNLLAAA